MLDAATPTLGRGVPGGGLPHGRLRERRSCSTAASASPAASATTMDELPGRRRPERARHRPGARREVTVGARPRLAGRGRPAALLPWVHLYDPHDPYEPPEPFAAASPAALRRRDRVHGRAGGPPAARPWRSAARPTLVAAVGDHGESLGEHQEPTHATSSTAPPSTCRFLFLPGRPARRAGGASRSCAAWTSCRRCSSSRGCRRAGGLDGRSLVPLVTGRSDRETGPRLPGVLRAAPVVGRAGAPGRADRALALHRAPRPELYNVEEDPAETVNLAAERPAELERLQALLRAMVPRATRSPTGRRWTRRRRASCARSATSAARPPTRSDGPRPCRTPRTSRPSCRKSHTPQGVPEPPRLRASALAAFQALAHEDAALDDDPRPRREGAARDEAPRRGVRRPTAPCATSSPTRRATTSAWPARASSRDARTEALALVREGLAAVPRLDRAPRERGHHPRGAEAAAGGRGRVSPRGRAGPARAAARSWRSRPSPTSRDARRTPPGCSRRSSSSARTRGRDGRPGGRLGAIAETLARDAPAAGSGGRLPARRSARARPGRPST